MALSLITFNGSTMYSNRLSNRLSKYSNRLYYASIREPGCFPYTGNQKDITISLKTKETTTNAGKKQKFSGKVREEIVEAI